MKKFAYIGVILFIITCLLISVSCSASKTSVQSNGTVWNTDLAPGAAGSAGRVVIPTVATTTTPPAVINSYGSTTDLNGQTSSLDIQRMICAHQRYYFDGQRYSHRDGQNFPTGRQYAGICRLFKSMER